MRPYSLLTAKHFQMRFTFDPLHRWGMNSWWIKVLIPNNVFHFYGHLCLWHYFWNTGSLHFLLPQFSMEVPSGVQFCTPTNRSVRSGPSASHRVRIMLRMANWSCSGFNNWQSLHRASSPPTAHMLLTLACFALYYLFYHFMIRQHQRQQE